MAGTNRLPDFYPGPGENQQKDIYPEVSKADLWEICCELAQRAHPESFDWAAENPWWVLGRILVERERLGHKLSQRQRLALRVFRENTGDGDE